MHVMTTLCDNDFYIEFLTKLDLLYQQLLSAKTFRFSMNIFVVLIDTCLGLFFTFQE